MPKTVNDEETEKLFVVTHSCASRNLNNTAFRRVRKSFFNWKWKKTSSGFCKSENFMIFAQPYGKLPEWSIGADSKSVVPFGVPGVRIPHSPPGTEDIRWKMQDKSRKINVLWDFLLVSLRHPKDAKKPQNDKVPLLNRY